MACPAPDRLLSVLAGSDGGSAQRAAEAHVQSCASCRGGLSAITSPSGSLRLLVGTIEPERAGVCPEIEDLACWSAGDPLSPESSARIAAHVSECEACGVLYGRLKLELGGPSGASTLSTLEPRNQPPKITQGALGSLRAGFVAQVAGAFSLAFLSIAVVLPRLHQHRPTQEPTSTQPSSLPPHAAIDSPFAAAFDFRLKGGSDTHTVMFPHHPGVHLSENYEYAVKVAVRRTGWLFVISIGPDRRPSLLLPDGDRSTDVPRLNAGDTRRFPSERAWRPIDRGPGRWNLYAVYLDNAAGTEKLFNECSAAYASASLAAELVKQLEDNMTAGSCLAVDHTCVQTLEYEVF